ncbi:MAG: hypothetical protein MN733_38140, partial [Nitrososphaera sp.]|nr:hypothetical protein [Nitrososphaera sp.]
RLLTPFRSRPYDSPLSLKRLPFFFLFLGKIILVMLYFLVSLFQLLPQFSVCLLQLYDLFRIINNMEPAENENQK